jgi:hypothetical protein
MSNGYTTGLVAAAALAACLAATAAQADSLLPATEFKETYLDTPPLSRGVVVGAHIVGLQVEGADRGFDVSKLHVALGDSTKSAPVLCVTLASRDGRYNAEASYGLAGASGASARLETRSAYAQKLSSYEASDIAMLAVPAKSCADAKTDNLTAVLLGSAEASNLVIQLAAGDARVRAQLGQNNKAISNPVVCQDPSDAVRIGFTKTCTIPLPLDLKPGQYQLSIGETASTGEIQVHTSLVTLVAPGNL